MQAIVSSLSVDDTGRGTGTTLRRPLVFESMEAAERYVLGEVEKLRAVNPENEYEQVGNTYIFGYDDGYVTFRVDAVQAPVRRAPVGTAGRAFRVNNIKS